MAGLFEKSINMGLGLFAYSREKVEEVVDDLVNKGEITKKDASQFAGELVKRGEEQREELKKLIRGEVMEAFNYAGIAKKQDIVTKEELRGIVREEILGVLKEQGLLDEETDRKA